MVKKVYRRRLRRRIRKRMPLSKVMSIPNRNNKFFATFMFTIPIGQISGAPADISYALSLMNPGYYRNSAATWGAVPNPSTFYTRCFDMFSQYKVIGIKITIIPVHVDVSVTSFASLDPVSAWIDLDYDNSALRTPTQHLNAGVVPLGFAAGNRVTRSFKPSKDQMLIWSDCDQVSNNPDSVVAALTRGQLNVVPNKYGTVGVTFPAVPDNLAIARMYISWRVVFKGPDLIQL